jgi:hypothetical protein
MVSNSKMFSWLVVGKIIAYLKLFSKSSVQVFSVAHFIKTPTENRMLMFADFFIFPKLTAVLSVLVCTVQRRIRPKTYVCMIRNVSVRIFRLSS